MIDYHKELVRILAEHLKLREEEVITVWFAKEINNAKGMFIVNTPFPSLYFEVTLNGENDEVYIDGYTQESHTAIKIKPHELYERTKYPERFIKIGE